ncbi:hypothetical protein KEM55_001821, partial [Ascosphaera atra]
AASQGFPVKPNIAWPTPGRYVDQDTLVQLCNCISGTEVPELLYNGMVFQRVEHPGDYADVALCLSLRGWARKPLNLEEVCLRPPSEGGGDLGDGHKNGNVGKALVPQQSSDGQGIGAKQQKEDDKQDIELSIQTDDAGWGEAHQSGAIKASQDERPVEIKQREADDNLGTSMSALAKEVLPQEKLGGEYEGEVEKGGIGPQESHTGHHVEAMQEEEDDNTGANLSVPWKYRLGDGRRKGGRVEGSFNIARQTLTAAPVTISYTHSVDSRKNFDAVDRGVFSSLPNGDALETGSMPRPDLPGAPVKPYEEVWKDLKPSGEGECYILESTGGAATEELLRGTNEAREERVVKTFIGKVPGFFIALRQELVYKRVQKGSSWELVKEAGDMSAKKQTWRSNATGTKDAVVTTCCGPVGETLPTIDDLPVKNEQNNVGGKVTVAGGEYTIRAFEHLQQS